MIRTALIVLASAAAVPAAIALGLIASQGPRGAAASAGGVAAGQGGLAFDRLPAGAEAAPLDTAPVTMRDGTPLATRHLPGPAGAPLLILVHGSGWDGSQFDALARRLEGAAEIVVPDLRGHGLSPRRRGDVDHVGQLEEDLADLIDRFRAPGRKVVLAGHSSGGGLVVRFAGGAYGAAMDRAILLAPFLQHDAPTTRPGSGGWARPLTRRIVGLSMLNAVGIHALDHLTAIEFAFPPEVLEGPQGGRATQAYSWRLNLSYAPRRDWRADVAALPPFVLAVGAEDEAFRPEAYRPAMSEVTDRGRYVVVEGRGHLDIIAAPEVEALIREVLADAG